MYRYQPRLGQYVQAAGAVAPVVGKLVGGGEAGATIVGAATGAAMGASVAGAATTAATTMGLMAAGAAAGSVVPVVGTIVGLLAGALMAYLGSQGPSKAWLSFATRVTQGWKNQQLDMQTFANEAVAAISLDQLRAAIGRYTAAAGSGGGTGRVPPPGYHGGGNGLARIPADPFDIYSAEDWPGGKIHKQYVPSTGGFFGTATAKLRELIAAKRTQLTAAAAAPGGGALRVPGGVLGIAARPVKLSTPGVVLGLGTLTFLGWRMMSGGRR